jgi:hypothetical protein
MLAVPDFQDIALANKLSQYALNEEFAAVVSFGQLLLSKGMVLVIQKYSFQA